MADQMLRMAGRGSDGLAKAIKTDTTGSLITKLEGSQSNVLGSKSGIVAPAASLNVEIEANGFLSKTVYVHSEKDGYAGIDVELGGEWFPYLKVRDEYLKDDFEGNDNPVKAAKWEVAKIGDPNVALTYAKEFNGSLELGMRSNSGTSHVFLTSNKKINAAMERIVNFSINETEYPTGVTAELNIGLTPTKPTNSNSIAGRVYIFRFRESKVFWAGGEQIVTPKADAKYTVVFNPSGYKIYREGVLVYEGAQTLPESEYFLYLQLSATTSAATRTAHVGEIVVWSKNDDAKVTGGELWVKSSTDAMPARMRVVFQNDLTAENNIKVFVVGQP